MKVRRDIASIPARSAAETWRVIVQLITGKGSVDASQLKAAASIMESLIADEHPATSPIVVKGSGPRLVIYCLYGEEAMAAEKSVDGLTWNPTAGDWCITAPCEEDDVKWMNNALKKRGPRISVRDVNKPAEDGEDAESSKGEDLTINWGVLG